MRPMVLPEHVSHGLRDPENVAAAKFFLQQFMPLVVIGGQRLRAGTQDAPYLAN